MSVYKLIALPRKGRQFALFADTWNPDSAGRAQECNADHQCPQAELKPAAFAFRQVGIERLGFHRRIIPDRGQREQEILAAG